MVQPTCFIGSWGTWLHSAIPSSLAPTAKITTITNNSSNKISKTNNEITTRQQITIPGLFSNQTITINALAAALALAALLLRELSLFFCRFWHLMIIDHKFTILPLFSSRHIISLPRELFVYCRFLDRLHLDPVATKVTVDCSEMAESPHILRLQIFGTISSWSCPILVWLQ